MADRSFANPAATNNPVGVSGLACGVGLDVMVSDRIFAGAEYLERSLDVDEGDVGGFSSFSHDQTLRSVGLRIGMRFQGRRVPTEPDGRAKARPFRVVKSFTSATVGALEVRCRCLP